MGVANTGGMFMGDSHANGGIPIVIVETGKHIEVEGKEPLIPAAVLQDSEVKEREGTNKEILHDMNKEAGAKGMSQKATEVHAGDAVICVRAAEDETVRKFKGTDAQIASAINESGGCNNIESGAVEIKANGEEVQYKEGGALPSNINKEIADLEALIGIEDDKKLIAGYKKEVERLKKENSKPDFDNSKKRRNFVEKIISKEVQNDISGQNNYRETDAIIAAINYIRGCKSSGSKLEESKPNKREEGELLKSYSKENNIHLPYPDLKNYMSRGAEQEVFLYGNKVVKTNDSICYESWEDYLINLLLHNYYFQDTAYTLLGITEKKGELYSVVEQPFILSTEETDIREVKKIMDENGFFNTRNNDYYSPEHRIVLEDLHDENVLMKNGIPYFIDTIFFVKEIKSGKHIGENIYKEGGVILTDLPQPQWYHGTCVPFKDLSTTHLGSEHPDFLSALGLHFTGDLSLAIEEFADIKKAKFQYFMKNKTHSKTDKDFDCRAYIVKVAAHKVLKIKESDLFRDILRYGFENGMINISKGEFDNIIGRMYWAEGYSGQFSLYADIEKRVLKKEIDINKIATLYRQDKLKSYDAVLYLNQIESPKDKRWDLIVWDISKVKVIDVIKENEFAHVELAEFKEGGKIGFDPNKLPSLERFMFAERVRAYYPKVWFLGGNNFGNKLFYHLRSVMKRGHWLEEEKWIYLKWQSYLAQHHKDHRISGIVAMLKRLGTVDEGWEFMKEEITKEIRKRYPNKPLHLPVTTGSKGINVVRMEDGGGVEGAMSESSKNEVVSFIKKQMLVDKKEYRGHIPTKYNKGSEWTDFSWLSSEIQMFLNKQSLTSYTLREFSDKYSYGILDKILKNNFKQEYQYVLRNFGTDIESGRFNELGGYEYSQEDQEIAKSVDLITLPESVDGTNCFNCIYVKKWDSEAGFCMHKKIKLPITAKMCCSLWDAEGAVRSWEKK